MVRRSSSSLRGVMCSWVSIGLVDYVSDPGTTAVDRALKLAEEIAVNGMALGLSLRCSYYSSDIVIGPLALRAAKQAISTAPEVSLERGLDFERACYEPLLKSKDRLEALEAFKEKRAPVFKGE